MFSCLKCDFLLIIKCRQRSIAFVRPIGAGAQFNESPTIDDCDATPITVGSVSYTRCRSATVSVRPSQLSGAPQFAVSFAHTGQLGRSCGSATPTSSTFVVVRKPIVTDANPKSICLGSSGTVNGKFSDISCISLQSI